MANPIKTSDLYQDTGELKKLIAELETVNDKLESLRQAEGQSAARLEVQMKKLTASTSAQREEIEAGSKSADEINKRYKKFTESLDDNAVKIAALKDAQTRLNMINKLEAKLLTEKEGSYNKLSAQYSLNKLLLNQMSAAQRKNTKEGQQLVKTTNDIYQEMKRLQEETGKHVLSVGDYEKGTRKLLAQLDQMPGVLGSASSGVKALGSQFKALLANPVVLVIAAIAGSLTVLFNAFKKSEKGAALMAKATGLFNGVMSQLVNISTKVAEAVEFAFSNPKEAILSLGKALVTGILNRFKGLAIAAFNTGRAIVESFKGNFEEAKKAAQDAVTGINQAITGLDAQGQKDLANAIRQTTQEVIDQTNAFIALEEAKRSVRTSNRELVKSIEQLITAEELAQVTADDSTKSFKDREAAAERARRAIEARAAKEIQLAKNNLSLLNQEISLRRGNGEQIEDLLDSQLEAYRAVIAAERELTVATAQNEKTRAELKQDRLERDLDILIDGFDNQKTINERIIADEEQTLQKRGQLYAETLALADETFAKQIETIQKFTGVNVDANELINESNAVVLNEKIRGLGLSEIIEGRLLEIVRERRTANQDLIEVERELAKLRRESLKIDQVPLLGFEKKLIAETKKDLEDLKAIVADVTIAPEQRQKPTDIYELFGLSVDDPTKQALSEATSFAIEQVNQLADAKVEASKRAVEASDREVESAQENLNSTIALAELGYAVNIGNAERELALAKENQEKALNNQRDAEKQKRQVETLTQASSLVTAAARIFAEVPFPGSLIAVGTMFGSFALSKIRAAKATREFGEGDYTILKGDRHSGKGTGIPLGVAADGVTEYAEGGESRAIFSRKAVKRYGNTIQDTVKAFNSLQYSDKTFSGMATAQYFNQSNISTSAMENELTRIRRNGELKTYTDSKGRRVEQYRNITTVYN